MAQPFIQKLKWPAMLGYALLLLLFGLTPACSTLKKAGLGKKEAKALSPEYVLANLEQQRFAPQWLNAKARITYEDESFSVGGSATIRLKKDSLLWMSIKKLGFEVVRAMVTPDSVYIIDRLNNEYAIFGLDYLEKTYSFPGDFQLLQSIFLGNPHFLNPREIVLEQESEALNLTDQYQEHQITYRINPGDFTLRALNYQDRFSDRQLWVDLEEYDKVDENRVFSYFRNLRMTSMETGNLGMTIKFSQIELDVPREMGFRIPPRYSRME